MVLGAGRGPLVSASIRASRQAARKIKVYAVEKNPNAIVTYVAIAIIAALACYFLKHAKCVLTIVRLLIIVSRRRVI